MIFWTCLFKKELHYREVMREFLFTLYIAIYVAKAVPLRATKALGGGGWRYSSYSFSTSVLDGVSGKRHAPAAL
jgi:hypothetical protein